MRVLAPSLAFLLGSVVTLQGCGGCDEDEFAECVTEKTTGATDCDGVNKLMDCYDDRCDEEGAEEATALGKTSFEALFDGCTVDDPCA